MIYSGNFFLSMEQMTNNAQYILDYLTASGWTKNAVCGLLGNLQTESSMNPAIWEGLNYGNLSGGYGLTQWTPATKFFDWCDDRSLSYEDMDSNLLRINYEVEHNAQWFHNVQLNLDPPYSFQGFTASTESPYDLAMNFLWFYEHPGESIQPDRGDQAMYWYDTLTGGEPPVNPTKRKKYKFYLYGRKRR